MIIRSRFTRRLIHQATLWLSPLLVFLQDLKATVSGPISVSLTAMIQSLRPSVLIPSIKACRLRTLRRQLRQNPLNIRPLSVMGQVWGAMLLYTSAGLSTRGSLSLDRSYLLGRTLGIANAPTLLSRIGLYTMSPNQSTRLWSFSIRCSSATKIISRRWWSLFIRTFEKSKSHLLVIPSWFRWRRPAFYALSSCTFLRPAK